MMKSKSFPLTPGPKENLLTVIGVFKPGGYLHLST